MENRLPTVFGLPSVIIALLEPLSSYALGWSFGG